MLGENLIAYLRELYRVPDGEWRIYQAEVNCFDHDTTTVNGSVAPIGKNGRRDWSQSDPETKRFFTYSSDRFDEWRKSHGICVRCDGTGQVVVSSSMKNGTTYRPCDACARKAVLDE